MRLSKPFIDVGLQTNQREAMLAFWGQEVGLTFQERLKLGGGVHQLRHDLNGSILKLNHARSALSNKQPSGYQGLVIADDSIEEPVTLFDPDGNRVTLVPLGYGGVEQLGIEISVRSLAAHQRFYQEVLSLEQVADRCFSWGDTKLFLTEDDRQPYCTARTGLGYRYLTVQVYDVDLEHRSVLDRGGLEGQAPQTLGDTARISFILDPDGNWIEISQRASLTGPLPRTS